MRMKASALFLQPVVPKREPLPIHVYCAAPAVERTRPTAPIGDQPVRLLAAAAAAAQAELVRKERRRPHYFQGDASVETGTHFERSNAHAPDSRFFDYQVPRLRRASRRASRRDSRRASPHESRRDSCHDSGRYFAP